MAGLFTAFASCAMSATIAVAVLVGLAQAASLAIINGTTYIPMSAMFSTDQSSCYNVSNASTTVAVRTTLLEEGAAAGAPRKRLLLVGCLQSCLRLWWCVAARWTPTTGVCDVASEQFCGDAQTPLRERYLRIDAGADATAFSPPLKLFTLTFSDVRSHDQAFTGCQDALSKGVSENGIVCIDPDGSGCFPVWCNFTNNEGYATIHRRYGAGLDFTNRNWSEYENGFGDISGEYWLGLRRIAALTKLSRKLVVDLVGNGDHQFSANYTQFHVASAASNYTLYVSGWTIGNSADDSLSTYNTRPFSTRDQDNDLLTPGNCATTRGGWWWDDCNPIKVNVNGDYLKDTATCVFWKGSGDTEGCKLQYIALRIRV